MNATELYNAVMASPGPLEDELMARIWCLAHGKIYRRYERRDNGDLLIWFSESGEIKEYMTALAHYECPDISTDAALDLVRVRFPAMLKQVREWLDPDSNERKWTAELRSSNSSEIFARESHENARNAIIAALLKAMRA